MHSAIKVTLGALALILPAYTMGAGCRLDPPRPLNSTGGATGGSTRCSTPSRSLDPSEAVREPPWRPPSHPVNGNFLPSAPKGGS
jgi:hypothetical protein